MINNGEMGSLYVLKKDFLRPDKTLKLDLHVQTSFKITAYSLITGTQWVEYNYMNKIGPKRKRTC